MPPSPEIAYYFERFGFCPPRICAEPPAGLGTVVVIPCFNEPNLLGALQALADCHPPTDPFEAIVVVNSAENAPADILAQNKRTLGAALEWAGRNPRFPLHLLSHPDFPAKQAGVGLARKVGMDEALSRLDRAGRLDGVIACFDADCVCAANYLVEVERFFRAQPRAPGASIYFEHPLSGTEDPHVYEAVTLYELHLRYYVEALRYAGFPHAFHTIGSSMAARARDYCAQGGMNKRQAGEDFYFLHKLIPLGAFGEINSTRIIASPRPSDRVPFGTGRAVGQYLCESRFESYPLEAFEDLRIFFSQALPLAHGASARASDVLTEFLKKSDFVEHVVKIRQHTASPEAFVKRFFRWFDGFMAMKFVHFARDNAYGSADVIETSAELLRRRLHSPIGENAQELLLAYRNLQRAGK